MKSFRFLVAAACLSAGLAASAFPAFAADISITAASVVPASNAVKSVGVAGETITQGQPLYFDSSTSKWFKADSNDATVAKHKATGIALTGSSASQPIVVQTGGDITVGGTLTAGSRYYVSGTAGGLAPEADLTTGMEVVLIGVAKSTTVLTLIFAASGVTL
jgi:hypothetical protein